MTAVPSEREPEVFQVRPFETPVLCSTRCLQREAKVSLQATENFVFCGETSLCETACGLVQRLIQVQGCLTLPKRAGLQHLHQVDC